MICVNAKTKNKTASGKGAFPDVMASVRSTIASLVFT